jgi:hypothetical protein
MKQFQFHPEDEDGDGARDQRRGNQALLAFFRVSPRGPHQTPRVSDKKS